MTSKALTEQWKRWVDYNLDRLVEQEKLREILIANGQFSVDSINKYFVEAQASYNRCAKFIQRIHNDFNDPIQQKNNLENLRNFFDQEKKNTPPGILLERLKYHWLSLDFTSENLEIRACKISFFVALNSLIESGYFIPFPNPVEFKFFPTRNNLGNHANIDLSSFKNISGRPQALTKINQDVLYILKNDENHPNTIDSGGFGEIYQGFYQGAPVAIKHVAIDKFDFSLRWKHILIYYRQSLVAHEQAFDNVLPLQEIFFYEEKSTFGTPGNSSILAIYPLCKIDFFELSKQRIFFNDYSDFKPFKQLLVALHGLHQKNICVNDLKAANILFDYSDNIFLHDFDLWLPKKISEIGSIHLHESSIPGACYGSHEIEFLASRDLSIIFPDKLDIWCYGGLILTGLGYFQQVDDLGWKKFNTENFAEVEGRSSAFFREKITELKNETENLISSALENLSAEIASENDEARKKFLTDVREVVSGCLAFDPKDRYSTEELLNHNLFASA